VTCAGDIAAETAGAAVTCTASEIAAETPSPLAVIRSVPVESASPAEALRVSTGCVVVEPLFGKELLLHAADMPSGMPVADSVTGPLKDPPVVTVICAVPDCPCTSVTLPVLDARASVGNTLVTFNARVASAA
jgi:hypothetical protein